jgi:hypothetical protein
MPCIKYLPVQITNTAIHTYVDMRRQHGINYFTDIFLVGCLTARALCVCGKTPDPSGSGSWWQSLPVLANQFTLEAHSADFCRLSGASVPRCAVLPSKRQRPICLPSGLCTIRCIFTTCVSKLCDPITVCTSYHSLDSASTHARHYRLFYVDQQNNSEEGQQGMPYISLPHGFVGRNADTLLWKAFLFYLFLFT